MVSDLYLHPMFRKHVEHLATDERVSLSYQRAKLVIKTYNLTVSDIQFCSPKFWEMFTDPILCLDMAMFTILAAHVGLAIGTLSRHLSRRPDLRPLVDRLLHFDTVGIYLLTERGHGLDAFNIETTATKVETGFILNTPCEEAAKFMPASSPSFGIPKVALVMARLIVDQEDRGLRFFIVPICDHREMYHGVSSTRLPPRSGTSPLDFSITRFDHVHLPPSALVSSNIYNLSKPTRPHEFWWDEIWRIKLGTMVVPAPLLSAIRAVAYIGGKYSMHRCLTGKGATRIPILTFRTQQWPIAHATAVGMVLSNWFPHALKHVIDLGTDHRINHAIAVITKTTICRHFQRCVRNVAERCGAQGTFEHNFMARIENEGHSVVIAEGDVLTLCIRLFSELLLGRYQLPLPDASSSVLAQHALSVLEENSKLLRGFPNGHRGEDFNSLVLPQSEPAIEAIGHALAYSAAVEAKLPQPILDVYECGVIRQDPAWYSENIGMSRIDQRIREDKAITSMLPHLTTYLADLDISKYVSAPIVSDRRWKEYLDSLPVFAGNALPEEICFVQARL